MVINEYRIRKLAEIIKRLEYRPILFDNPDLFPEWDEYIYPNYVFFMVAIDHRTGFDREIVGSGYYGSDLLFYLARRKQMKEPEFFTAKNLKGISVSEVKSIFTYRGATVRNVEERTYLLRDCAAKLFEFYSGDIANLFKKADYFLAGEGGILGRLKTFRAYEDPFMKKSFLFIKILKRQGLKIKDPFNLGFPVDSVLVRVALSSKIVEPEKEVMKKIYAGESLTEDETNKLRRFTAKALEKLSLEAEIEPDVLDDILWVYGREIDSGCKTPLDSRVNEGVIEEFMSFIRTRFVGRINFPSTWYF
jgi:hypothetical protein